VLERGPWLSSDEFEHDFKLGVSYTRICDIVAGDGMSVLGGNCVGGGSVVYFATMPRAPGFVFDRRGSIGRRMWPESISRATLDPWYDRVCEALPVSMQSWDEVTYPGGLWAAACNHAGRTANPSPVAIDTARYTNCNRMTAGCRFDAKRSLLLNYLPAALSHGAEIRPMHEVQSLSRTADGGYRASRAGIAWTAHCPSTRGSHSSSFTSRPASARSWPRRRVPRNPPGSGCRRGISSSAGIPG
jgi:hypothetical protein